MNKHYIKFTSQFLRKYRKITKNNSVLIREIKNKLYILACDPFQSTLRTHKYNLRYSSSITGDIRVIWRFTKPNEITLLNIGGHEGKLGVYK